MTDHLASKPFAEMIRSFASGSIMRDATADLSVTFQDIPKRGKSRSRKRDEETDSTSIYMDEDELSALTDELSIDSVRRSGPELEDEDDIPYDAAFDELIESAFTIDEDVQFRNNLISMGRKYAVKGSEHSESSEVQKAYARQEQEIDMLIQEYNQAGLELQRDIDFIRSMRTKNYKALADLQAVRASYFSGKLAAIKEKNSMVKSRYDINLKLKAASGEADSDSSTAASRAIQQMFSMGRNTMRASIDPGDSGATDDGAEEIIPSQRYRDELNDPDTAIHFAAGIPPAKSDGDKFIEHERDGVEWVLDIGEDGTERNIYAINSAGDVVPDYPLPSDDPHNLQFLFNNINGTATDQLQRTYRVRKAGVDVVKEE